MIKTLAFAELMAKIENQSAGSQKLPAFFVGAHPAIQMRKSVIAAVAKQFKNDAHLNARLKLTCPGAGAIYSYGQ